MMARHRDQQHDDHRHADHVPPHRDAVEDEHQVAGEDVDQAVHGQDDREQDEHDVQRRSERWSMAKLKMKWTL